MHRRTATEELIREVLGEDYLQLQVQSYQMVEDVSGEHPCRVSVVLTHANGERDEEKIEGEGVGLVDALYNGLMEHYAREFESLKTIEFTGFTVKGKMETSREHQGADAEGIVDLTVTNSEGITFDFYDTGRSMVRSALKVVVEATEFFVNSERAFIVMHRALKDAQERGRGDLVQKYTGQLAQLVSNTSYTRVIERIKKETLQK